MSRVAPGFAAVRTAHRPEVSIDSHKFFVFAADGAYIEPVKVNVSNSKRDTVDVLSPP